MNTLSMALLLASRVAMYLGLIYLVLLVLRLARARNPLLGLLLALGIVVRAALGSLLFAISYFRLPFLTGLQLGGGFWTLALDARSYFDAAVSAAHLGLSTINSGSASPTYVRLLAVWLEIFGVSPASAVLLNLACYVLVAALIVTASRNTVATGVALGLVTVSPALIIFGTQALKDSLSVMLIVLAMAGLRMWTEMVSGTSREALRDGTLGASLLSAAVYASAGIRAYFALFMVMSVCAAAFASVAIALGRRDRLKAASSYATLLPLLWVMFVMGAGAYYAYYGSFIDAALGHPMRSVTALDGARAAFVATGGATSVADEATDVETSMPITGGWRGRPSQTYSAGLRGPVRSDLRAAHVVDRHVHRRERFAGDHRHRYAHDGCRDSRQSAVSFQRRAVRPLGAHRRLHARARRADDVFDGVCGDELRNAFSASAIGCHASMGPPSL
jgi:hypothetical protein